MTLMTPTATWATDEHHIFASSTARFLQDNLVPNIPAYLENGKVDRAFWRQAGEAGLMAGAVPEDFGGAGGGAAFDAIVTYEQARAGDSGWGFSLQTIVMHYLMALGSSEQKERWLPKLVSGDMIGALAMTEPGTGSDVQAIRMTAEKDGNSYRLNGSKMFITNGYQADLIIVVVKTDPAAGAKGTSLIVVETENLDGFSRSQPLKKLGMKANDTAALTFEDARVPLTNLLGPDEGMGFAQLMQQLPWERLIIGISALGAIDHALEMTVSYTQDRQAFGQRIMDMQNTRFKLAECKTKAEMLRAFINNAIAMMEQGTLDATTASMAKYWGSEIQNEIINECLQLHGGYGFMKEYPISRLYADARVQMIYGGSNEIMKELIARSLDR